MYNILQSFTIDILDWKIQKNEKVTAAIRYLNML